MAHFRHIHDLPDELLSEVLYFLVLSQSKPEPGVRAINRGSYKNRQSFGFGETSDLDRFRLVCTRFMRIATPRKFSHFNLRFSEKGFRRLDELLQMQLACYVKSMTYLVRPFYQGNGLAPMLHSFGTKHPALAKVHRGRLREQIDLVSNGTDLSQLRTAIASFSALQQLKLLRVQDGADEILLDFVDDYDLVNETANSQDTTHFSFEYACARAIRNLGISLVESQRTSIRFIGHQINPEATLQLLHVPSTALAAVGPRITSLDINFHCESDISPIMTELSDVFKNFFLEAKNLVAIHIGFLPEHPFSITLDTIFHSFHWKTLRMLSLQGWYLTPEDLILLLRRHHAHLRALHLAFISLRAGKWASVLNVLRHEMQRLDRLELRQIRYDKSFISNDAEIIEPVPLPPHSSSSKVQWLSADELGDDGVHVRRGQERLWETWVLTGRWQNERGQVSNGYQNGYQNGNGNGYGNGHENRAINTTESP